MSKEATALIIGAGPAGLMAAETLARAGMAVIVADAKPSVGRKFLMAGKSGLNLTKEEPKDLFLKRFDAPGLVPVISEFCADDVKAWAMSLGQEVFTGSTGRVFPRKMKASPLLRAWLARLNDLGVTFRTRWRWCGWKSDNAVFDTPEGTESVSADVTVLALGGASWARLGSDGKWAETLRAEKVPCAAFAPSNTGVIVNWSKHMEGFFGQPIKAGRLTAGGAQSRGEWIVSAKGIEGAGIYALSTALRRNAPLQFDPLPDLSVAEVRSRLSRPRGKSSLANHLRKTLRLRPVVWALMNECARPLPRDPGALAKTVKALPIPYVGMRPMDEAISTTGGVSWDGVSERLMLKTKPGVFVAGEMLDWDAPTGGYLITACLATGRWAGQSAIDFVTENGG